jgi:hypothetical protein
MLCSTVFGCKFSNVPIGVFTLISISTFLKLKISDGKRQLPFKEKLKYMNFLGTVLFVGAICCLLLALQWGGETDRWESAKIIGLFVGGGLLLFLFGYTQWKRGETAIIPLRVLRQRSILSGAMFLFFLGMSSIVVSEQAPRNPDHGFADTFYSTPTIFPSISNRFKEFLLLRAELDSLH